jgi:serine/threonine protein kinase
VFKANLEVAAKSFHGLINPELYGALPNTPEYEFLLEEFKKEAINLQTLRHPNLVEFYGVVWESDQRPKFLVTELALGSLQDTLKEHPQGLPFQETCKIALQIARGLEYLHSNQICHRDLKPANILRFPGEIYKIADFGGAKRIDRASSHTLFGTPDYCAPEVQSGHYTLSADMFSFGLIVVELLFGALKPPFDISSRVMFLVTIITSGGVPKNPDLTQRYPQIAPSLLRCFAMSQDGTAGNRPSCSELVDVLSRCV